MSSGGLFMTDKEFLDGENTCPVYGEGCKPEFCADCEVGSDGTAVCPFRKMPFADKSEDENEG